MLRSNQSHRNAITKHLGLIAMTFFHSSLAAFLAGEALKRNAREEQERKRKAKIPLADFVAPPVRQNKPTLPARNRINRMKDIGYYAGFLSSAAQTEITNASIYQLKELLCEVAEAVYAYDTSGTGYALLEHLGWEDASPRDQVALIRGLCDRIELKLMEEAV